MITGYVMRFEFADGTVEELAIPATNLTSARVLAEGGIFKLGHWTQPPAVDWRGAVAFVECKPAEERIQVGRWRHVELFKAESLKAHFRPLRHVGKHPTLALPYGLPQRASVG